MEDLTKYTVCQDGDTIVEVIRRCVQEQASDPQNEDQSFFVTDLGYQVKMVEQWKELLPKVHPYYAVKANPDPVILAMLAQLEFGFDCASKSEIETILDLGVDPCRIIYAHTRKQISFLKYAASVGVDKTTFDDEDELKKIKQFAPNMKLLLRVSGTSFSHNLSAGMAEKFGCPKENTKYLLGRARELQLHVVGVSFHVGSSPRNTEGFASAIKIAKLVFTEGRALGFNMTILDIGGGFPAKTTTNYSKISFSLVADTIRRKIDEEFGNDDTLKIIAEPGGYFSMPCAVLVTNIIGTRLRKPRGSIASNDEGDDPLLEYFINDGIFSSFMNYYTIPEIQPVAKPVAVEHVEAPVRRCKIWGHTCNGSDVVLEECRLPEMATGDWMYFTDQGSYAGCMFSEFNGFQKPNVYRYINSSLKTKFDDFLAKGTFKHLEDTN